MPITVAHDPKPGVTLGIRRACARVLVLWLAISLATPVGAQTSRPLLVEGTHSVYQRVLTRPGAPLSADPSGATISTYPAFQPLYVFARAPGWIEVGPSVNAPPQGWVPEDKLVAWKQNIVGAFTNSAGRKRQLLFDTQEHLRGLLNNEALTTVQDRLLADADSGKSDGSSGVVSVEPKEFVNIRDNLYLMPILDFVEDLHPANYEDLLLMQVASVPKEAAPPSAPAGGQDQVQAFDVGIVFVFDTTQSMDPYIALTQQVLENIVRDMAGTDIGDHLNFGVIGFRDNPEAAPGLEYRTRTLVELKRRNDQSEVLAGIGAATQVARVSSPGFNEDSLAGVEDAIDTVDWDQAKGNGDPIDARYVILVTDAGPKDPHDPNARSEIGVSELQADAEDKNIVLMTLHLKTPQGAATHEYAADKYRELSRFAGGEFYFPIENGAEEAFASVTGRLVTALTDQVRLVRGQAPVLPPEEAGADLVSLGRAIQLAYLGTQRGTQVPDVVTGWLSDKAVEDPAKLAVEPRLLLTKNEMATMAELLDNLVRLGEQAQDTGDAYTFFGQVRGVIADMATNPDMVVNPDAKTLGGALEYLERLPYRSQLLQMTEDRWGQSAMLRRSILDGMRQKLVQYRKWLYDESVWTALYDGAPDGEHVFAMPFDVLP